MYTGAVLKLETKLTSPGGFCQEIVLVSGNCVCLAEDFFSPPLKSSPDPIFLPGMKKDPGKGSMFEL